MQKSPTANGEDESHPDVMFDQVNKTNILSSVQRNMGKETPHPLNIKNHVRMPSHLIEKYLPFHDHYFCD